jgi:hypothetical protein
MHPLYIPKIIVASHENSLMPGRVSPPDWDELAVLTEAIYCELERTVAQPNRHVPNHREGVQCPELQDSAQSRPPQTSAKSRSSEFCEACRAWVSENSHSCHKRHCRSIYTKSPTMAGRIFGVDLADLLSRPNQKNVPTTVKRLLVILQKKGMAESV